jgi:hypothetical protein
MFLIVDNEACHSLPTQWLVFGWDDFASLFLLELKGLEEVNKYCSLLSSSLLVVKLISVERIDSAFLFPLLTACSPFRFQLPFNCINFFEKEEKAKDFFPGPALASNQALLFLCCLILGIDLKSVMLWLFLSQ